MFTGIIEAVGEIRRIEPKGQDVTLEIATGKLDLSDVKLGDSIASNGVCLTVVALSSDSFCADLSTETLKRSNFASASRGARVNLEKAVTPTTRLGGHLVSGHVDALAEVVSRESTGRAIEFWLQAPEHLARYITEKGSICIDGISLTVNAVDGARFKLTIVPHTADETTMKGFQTGIKVNLEVDQIARYIERLMLGDKAAVSEAQPQSDVMALLGRTGFLK
ncbi:riboflavin synthase [Corallincola luteus]|uniref:Riboflavin synthase n=1 Tax=Corallincola luteus TaxID=1775177 RepID=A0ABY2AK91_9GAMM|nr:riboflavin synthase [Corallincola luteus]TCI02878.1 riboflavin synthase [Corallincola luteus]